MKKNNNVIIYAYNGGADIDQYGIFRNEVRIPLNIGFGLSELGYNVNIINPLFNELTTKPKLIENKGNITLSKVPISNHYNYSLAWNWFHIEDVLYDRAICLTNYPREARDAIVNIKNGNKKIRNRELIIATPYEHLVEHMNQNDGFGTKHLNGAILKTEFLPPLHPIPCYQLGFSEYNCNLNKKSGWLKIYVYICSWEKNLKGITEYSAVLEDIKKITNLKLKLYIQLDSPDTINDLENLSNITKIGDEIEYIYKKRYDEFLNMISNMDLFLIKGTQFMASAGIYDIISMGKPMMYISENMSGRLFRNPLFEHEKEILFMGSTREHINKMTTNFINNPSISYNKFRDSMKDSDFKNWKIHAEKIFDLSN